MMLLMVWLFPVPGGPWRTKLIPRLDISMASCCEESASRIWKESAGRTMASMRSALGWSGSAGSSDGSPASALMNGCLASLSCSTSSSWYMLSLAKEKRPRYTLASTFHPGAAEMDALTSSKNASKDMSSSGHSGSVSERSAFNL